MSQIYKRLTSSGPIPGNIPTSFVTDDGTAVPDSNVLEVFGRDAVPTNNQKGIETVGGFVAAGDTNRVGVRVTNRVIQTAQTSNIDQTVIAGALSLGSFANGTVIIDGTTGAYNKTDNLSAGYRISGVVRVTGGALTEIGIETSNVFVEGAMSACVLEVLVDGTTFAIQVTGIADKTINWFTQFDYTFTSGVTP